MRKLGFLLLAGSVAWISVACADGSELGPGYEQQPGTGGAGGAGGDDTTGDGGATSSSSSASSGMSSSSSSSSSGAGGGGAGGSCDYTAPTPCATAAEIPEIKGDDGGDIRTRNGDTSEWFHVYVSESVSDPFNYPQLSYTASLVSPAGMDYDLYVYTGNENDVNCGATPVKGTGSPEEVSDTWGDSIGSEDGTWIALEVRYVSGGECGSDATWMLTVAGHTDP